MQPYQQRVVDEKANLDAAIAALEKFITSNSEAYLATSANEKVRLDYQYEVMVEYSDVLGERIEAFGSL